MSRASFRTPIPANFARRCKAFTMFGGMPDIVVFPNSTEEVSKIVKLCNREKIPFVPRGSGTSLSGSSIAIQGGVMIVLSRMNRVLEVDLENEIMVVQPGLVNKELTNQLAGTRYLYAPDPASQIACTIGGNLAHNAGGPHCLKYGVTTDHVLGVEVVLSSGEIVNLGGKTLEHMIRSYQFDDRLRRDSRNCNESNRKNH